MHSRPGTFARHLVPLCLVLLSALCPVRTGAAHVSSYLEGLRSSLDEPLSSHPTLYRVSGENVYQPLSRFVWIRIPPGQAIHCSFGAVVHELGAAATDRLMGRTASLGVERYLTVDLPRLERSSLDIIEPGLFKVKGLPRDPTSENLRALGWLLAAADEVLAPSARTVLHGHVRGIFGRHAPVAP